MNRRFIRSILIVLAVVLLILVVLLIANYLSLRRQQLINLRELHFSELLDHHTPLPVSSAGIIRSWMTFDYVNKLFALPPAYLQARLQITDSHYPRLTISGYAKSKNFDAAIFLSQVENAIQNYTAPTNASST